MMDGVTVLDVSAQRHVCRRAKRQMVSSLDQPPGVSAPAASAPPPSPAVQQCERRDAPPGAAAFLVCFCRCTYHINIIQSSSDTGAPAAPRLAGCVYSDAPLPRPRAPRHPAGPARPRRACNKTQKKPKSKTNPKELKNSPKELKSGPKELKSVPKELKNAG